MTLIEPAAENGSPRPRVAGHPAATRQGMDETASARMAVAATVAARAARLRRASRCSSLRQQLPAPVTRGFRQPPASAGDRWHRLKGEGRRDRRRRGRDRRRRGSRDLDRRRRRHGSRQVKPSYAHEGERGG